MKRWYCCYTRSRLEQLAEDHLIRQGFETFLPKFIDEQKRARDRKPQPLFPRYLFTAFDVNESGWRRAAHTYGIVKILSVDPETPIPIDDRALEVVRQQTQPSTTQIEVGSIIIFRNGKFVDMTGICKWTKEKRIAVMVYIMGREVEVTCKREDIALVTK